MGSRNDGKPHAATGSHMKQDDKKQHEATGSDRKRQEAIGSDRKRQEATGSDRKR
jgi:hypothetical protein